MKVFIVMFACAFFINESHTVHVSINLSNKQPKNVTYRKFIFTERLDSAWKSFKVLSNARCAETCSANPESCSSYNFRRIQDKTFRAVCELNGPSASPPTPSSDEVDYFERAVKPGQPGKPVASVHVDHAHVTWTPPQDDGGAEINNFKLEIRRSDDYKWMPVNAEEEIPGNSFLMRGLTRGVVYEIRVKAENEAGTGEPSIPSESFKRTIPDCNTNLQMPCKDGWLIFANRYDGSVDFNKGWHEYINGFGDIHGEYFLGFDNILTILKQGQYKLRVELTTWPADGNLTKYAEYGQFNMAGEDDYFRLTATDYSGSLGNSLNYHNNQRFSTKDKDNDGKGDGSCAILTAGAWWYDNCKDCNLFGLYSTPGVVGGGRCMYWSKWGGSIRGDPDNYTYSYKEMRMMLKSI